MSKEYDPDRMNIEDIDPDDPDAIMAYLEDPNTEALFDDLGRMFRNEPSEVQISELRQTLEQQTAHRDLAEESSRETPDPQARLALQRYRDRLNEMIERTRARIAELGG